MNAADNYATYTISYQVGAGNGNAIPYMAHESMETLIVASVVNGSAPAYQASNYILIVAHLDWMD